MSVGSLSPQQLRSIVEEKWGRDEDALAVGLHVAGPWSGPDEVEFEFGKARVVRADTVFGIRQALRDAEKTRGRIILLTRLQQGDLGHDVVARLARSRLFAIDHWATLCALFRAKELDRSACDPAIARSLIEHAPPDGYPPVSAGLLDGGTVWRALRRHVFDMGESEPDLASLLTWATSKSGAGRYLGAAPELRTSLRRELTTRLGEAADSVFRFIEGGAAADALPLAIACQVVHAGGVDPALEAAAARMEQYHDNRPIPPAIGRVLAQAAADAIADLDRLDDVAAGHRHLQRADELLRQFRCEDWAHLGRLTPLGFERRLARFGAQIEAAIASPSDEAIRKAEQLWVEVADHRLARIGRRRGQVDRAGMALRLLRWLGRPSTAALAFPAFADAYRRELAFVDWARESIGRGDDSVGLAKAYLSLDGAVLGRREQFNRAFAGSLADWTASGTAGGPVWGVEDVIPRALAGVVQAGNRALLIVLDGMSWAACHELLDDLRDEHWSPVTLEESGEPPPPVIAAIPSVTNRSRASLLSGALVDGDASAEKQNFESNARLRACCDKKYPPLLFHKKQVTDGARGPVGEDLTRAILSTHHRAVGAVLNAIDDRLAGAEQIRDDWTVDRIAPLGALLKLARDSDRLVILASDHGHAWHRPDARSAPLESGGRWRPADGDPLDDEIILSGARVRGVEGADRVIAPWSERVRYGRAQNGYHGGATPQEMVCPLVILAYSGGAASGLSACEYGKPDWWSPAPARAAAPVEIRRAPPPPVAKRPPTLFDLDPHEPEVPGVMPARPEIEIDRLFSSAVYKAQKDLVRRHAPGDDVIRRALVALRAAGGLMTPAAFAQAAELPPARLDGLIARIQRLINVDGYEILTLDRAENRVELNMPRLLRQFDLD